MRARLVASALASSVAPSLPQRLPSRLRLVSVELWAMTLERCSPRGNGGTGSAHDRSWAT